MNQTPQQRNWERIVSESLEVITGLDGPVPGKTWDDFGGETARTEFTEAVKSILEAELASRTGDTTTVMVDIKDALKNLGERLVQAEAATARQGASDA